MKLSTFIKHLEALKERYGGDILILTHTGYSPKVTYSRPIKRANVCAALVIHDKR